MHHWLPIFYLGNQNILDCLCSIFQYHQPLFNQWCFFQLITTTSESQCKPDLGVLHPIAVNDLKHCKVYQIFRDCGNLLAVFSQVTLSFAQSHQSRYCCRGKGSLGNRGSSCSLQRLICRAIAHMPKDKSKGLETEWTTFQVPRQPTMTSRKLQPTRAFLCMTATQNRSQNERTYSGYKPLPYKTGNPGHNG